MSSTWKRAAAFYALTFLLLAAGLIGTSLLRALCFPGPSTPGPPQPGALASWGCS